MLQNHTILALFGNVIATWADFLKPIPSLSKVEIHNQAPAMLKMGYILCPKSYLVVLLYLKRNLLENNE